MDLSVFSPVCLPEKRKRFVGENGFVYGEWQKGGGRGGDILQIVLFPGWGQQDGVLSTSTEKLREAQVGIVQSSKCLAQTSENVNGKLIVCTSGTSEGPCEVGIQKYSCFICR